MSQLSERIEAILSDNRITPQEVAVIEEYVTEDGTLDMSDVRFLIELLANADEVCGEFDDLFFPVLKRVMLQDGRIDEGEQYYLLKMLYSDGKVRPSELQFLQELRDEALQVPREFDELLETAEAAHPTDWSLDGDEPTERSIASSGW